MKRNEKVLTDMDKGFGIGSRERETGTAPPLPLRIRRGEKRRKGI
jgi:hypothetical protein